MDSDIDNEEPTEPQTTYSVYVEEIDSWHNVAYIEEIDERLGYAYELGEEVLGMDTYSVEGLLKMVTYEGYWMSDILNYYCLCAGINLWNFYGIF